ncbi:MAG: hypothetical protein U0457_21425 [Candidatus Sericytochromatia bacterium]
MSQKNKNKVFYDTSISNEVNEIIELLEQEIKEDSLISKNSSEIEKIMKYAEKSGKSTVFLQDRQFLYVLPKHLNLEYKLSTLH